MNATNTAIRLAKAYVGSDALGINGTLRHLYLANRNHPIGLLSVSLIGEFGQLCQVDGLLCDIERIDRDIDHSFCCDGECWCLGKSACERCDDLRLDALHQRVDDLLKIVPASIRTALEAA